MRGAVPLSLPVYTAATQSLISGDFLPLSCWYIQDANSFKTLCAKRPSVSASNVLLLFNIMAVERMRRRSAPSLLSVTVFATLLSRSLQHDPVEDFCRRFGHQTAVVDRKLYIDGGLVNWKPLDSGHQNYTSKPSPLRRSPCGS